MKCLYIYNPNSGKGKAEKNKDYIINNLSNHFSKLDIVATQYPGHAKILASDACGNYDYLIVAGGDGTLNEVVNGIAERENRPILGYIPLGTVNDFAHSVGISKNIKICNGNPISHEIFKVNQKYGVYVCAMGVGTQTSYITKQKSKKILGKLAYFFSAFKLVFKAKPMPLTLKFEGGEIKDNFALLLAINSRYVAGFKVNKNFALNDGYIDLVLVKNNKKRITIKSLFSIAKIFLFGIKKKASKNIIKLRLKSFNLFSPDSEVINLDGEGVGSGDMKFEVIKDGIKIIV